MGGIRTKILQTRVGPDHQLQDLPSLAVRPLLTSRTPAQRRCFPRHRDHWKDRFPVVQFRRSHSQAKHGQTRRPQPSGLKAHEQGIFSNSIIRCGRDGLLPRANSKDEKDRVTSAETFFSTAHEFLYSAGSFRDHPINTLIPEIVVLGASNVGKSSFPQCFDGQVGYGQGESATRPHDDDECVRRWANANDIVRSCAERGYPA